MTLSDVTKHRTACIAHTAYTARLRLTCMVSNWTFCPFVSSPPSLIQHFLLIFLLIQLKPKHHHLDVLTIFQRGVRGVRGVVCGVS